MKRTHRCAMHSDTMSWSERRAGEPARRCAIICAINGAGLSSLGSTGELGSFAVVLAMDASCKSSCRRERTN